MRYLRYAYLLRHPGKRVYQLHLGCGQRRLPGFVNIDHNQGDAVDYPCDISRLPCPPNSIRRIETYHVIEHIPHRTAPQVLQHWYSILCPGGLLVIECPDFDEDVRQYLAGNEERLWSIFGRQRFAGDAHYFGYNRRRLTAALQAAGFTSIEEHQPEDYHALNEPCLRYECQKPR